MLWTDMEILVVFMKVFRQLTYQEIGRHLGMDYKRPALFLTMRRKNEERMENTE